jgi:hypothetical protein
MAEPTTEPKRDTFVPASFEDLRRNTREEGERFTRENQIRTRQDFGDLVSQGDFMKQSKLIGIGAIALGALLILAAYIKPLFQTADAVQTAAAVAADKAHQQIGAAQGAVGSVASQAAFIKDTDTKAINMAKGGLACLNGQAACANGASSPFK